MLKGIKYKRFALLVLLTLLVASFTVTQDYFVVTVGESHTYYVSGNDESEYYWTVFSDPDFMVSAPASEAHFPNGNTGHSAEIEWRKDGLYYVAVVESDLSGCMNIKVKAVQVQSAEFTVSAGNDTIIGNCHPFQLKSIFDIQEGMTYTFNWEPAEFLDDPVSATPLFTPGSSTRFSLTVTNNSGATAYSTVQVSVLEVVAEAGNDFIHLSGRYSGTRWQL